VGSSTSSTVWAIFNWYSGGWSPVGSTRHCGHQYCATRGDYDDGEIGGMMIGRGNRSTRKKPAPVPLRPPQIPRACLNANPGSRGGKPATNRLSYGMAFIVVIATGFGMDDWGFGVRIPVGSSFFILCTRADRFRGLPSILSIDYRGLFLRGLRVRAVKLSTHPHEVKNTWIYISTPPYVFMT
jgi:hypothetical protein